MIQMGNFMSSYRAVMNGMCGNELTDLTKRSHDWVCESALDALKAMRMLELMKDGDVAYITVGTMVGYVGHDTREDAIAWARETHPSQKPFAFKVERTKACWKTTNLLF